MMAAFGSVVYGQAYRYARDFAGSINGQTCREFDVLLINDDLKRDQTDELVESIHRHTVLVDSERHRIFETRVLLLKEAAKRGYDLLVMGDFDDRCSPERMEKMINAAQTDKIPHVFYYNDLLAFDGTRAFQEMPSETRDFRQILESNYLGMGNTAVRANALSEAFLQSLLEGDTKVFDWYLFTRLLLAGYTGRYVEGADTLYRIHGENLAGLPGESAEALVRETEVKLEHYRLLEPFHREFSLKLKDYQRIKEKLNHNITVKTAQNISCYWWGMIKAVENEEVNHDV